ncbi:MAG: ATPase [Rhodospirillales bacterium]|nr:ATPase [Rhodospirillales bacterium]
MRPAKRFYRTVALAPSAGAFGVLLDGRPLKTPEGNVLRVPTAALAAAIANEWLGQGETLRMDDMPLTRLAATAGERMVPRRAAVIDAIVAYGASDLLCYRAAEPQDLVLLQARVWQPLVDWAGERFAAPLRVGSGVLPIDQPAASLEGLRRAVDAIGPIELTALSCAVEASGSLIIGLALVERTIDADGAFAAATLDEQYQAGRWGVDAEAERRRRSIAADLRAAASFLALSSASAVAA